VKRRKALGFTQERLAERLGVDPTTVRRWESGETQTGPQPWLRPKLARYLQVSVEHLDELFAEATDADTGFDARLDYSLRHPSSVDLVSVARLREQVDDLDKRYDQAPSTLLLAEAGQRLGQLSFLSAHASVNCVRRESWAVEAAAATLMGQLVWDASQRRDHTTAHAYFDRAIGAARQRHDLAAEGLALLRKSFVALYGEKDPQRGLQLTMQTAETTKTTSYVLTGLGLLHTAEAHAMLGRLSDCERALSEADRYFSRIEGTDAALDLFSPTQFGPCRLLLPGLGQGPTSATSS
jgi:transcriptional regulator with XRE-family HTH domain